MGWKGYVGWRFWVVLGVMFVMTMKNEKGKILFMRCWRKVTLFASEPAANGYALRTCTKLCHSSHSPWAWMITWVRI